MKQIPLAAGTCLIAVACLITSINIAWADSDAARIVRMQGAVRIEVAGKPVPARIGGTVPLPARVATGSDGSLRIEQPSATLDIGPNSIVLLPAADASRQNIIQDLGRVLYSVKPRKTRTFSVQTPYLVSVVKGTLFSVAIENETTEVALLEGSVELVAEDIEAVMLHPNETARRGENGRSIDVTKIDTTAPRTSPQTNATSINSAIGSGSAADERALLDPATLDDLNEIASVSRDVRAAAPIVPPVDDTPLPQEPTVPGTGPTPPPEEPAPPAPEVPSEPPPAPVEPDVDPMPGDDDDGDDDDCRRKKCDSPDDHDNGDGNDDRDDKPGRTSR